MKQIVIIADDLTGACDTGVKFHQAGLKTKVLVTPNSVQILGKNPVPVVSVNTDTRSVCAEAAQATVESLARELKQRGDWFYYKKVDSVLRGNVVAELEALFQVLNPDFALLAPAFPATGRWLRDGILSIGSKEKPQLQIHALERISSETQRKCGHIPLALVRQGSQRVVEKALELYAQGCSILLADSWCECDLETLADAVLLLGPRCLSVGSAGLASHLASRMVHDCPVPYPVKMSGGAGSGTMLVVAGSRHPVTVEQVQCLKEAVPMETYILNVEGINGENLLQRVEDAFASKEPGNGKNILLTTDHIYYSRDNCQHLLQENAYNQAILDGIGASVERLLTRDPIKGMIATGGDIAGEILKRLKLVQIDLMAEPIAGIVTGFAADEAGKGFLLSTKSGGFGNERALLELYHYMQNC